MPRSFESAKKECKEFGGQLLLLENAKEVKEAIGDTMVGNGDEYRIDGWSDGKW